MVKKALLVGINYIGQGDMHIEGCIDDVVSVKQMLINKLGYEERNIVVLRDDVNDSRVQPTGKNIMDHLISIIRQSNNIDEFWFHYSGHGSQIDDRDGDELDKKDEIIFPVDYASGGIIHDDIFKQVAQYLKCKTMMVFDCCHSGTICDLPYHYDVIGNTMKHVVQNNDGCSNKQIYKISGSRDDQVSLSMYDREHGKMKGACTNAMMRILHAYDFSISMKQLLVEMNQWVRTHGSDQCPTYATSDPDTLDHMFDHVFSISNSVSGTQECTSCEKLSDDLDVSKRACESLKKQNDALNKEKSLFKSKIKSLEREKANAQRYMQRYRSLYMSANRRVRQLTSMLRRRR